MKVHKYQTAGHFLETTSKFLYENEIASELILSNALWQRDSGETARRAEFLAVIDDGRPVMAAMHKPDFWPTMTAGPEQACSELARSFWRFFPDARGALGPKDSVASFVSEWVRLSGHEAEVREQRIYQCTHVEQVPLPKGAVRTADANDFALVRQWIHDFQHEQNIGASQNDEHTRHEVEKGHYLIWEADEPVAIVGFGRETSNGCTVGPVYTPPEFRQQGYATACVAAATRAILNRGKRYALLHAGLNKQSTNSLYQKVGYRPVMDSGLWTFTAP